MGKKIDLTGQRFGYLVVLSEIKERKNKQIQWLCKCDCGNQLSVLGASLRSGNTKSCGCMKNKGLIDYNNKKSEEVKIAVGTIFGNLKVIEDLGYRNYYNSGHRRRYYLCECLKCGSLKEYTQNALKSNHVVSCGCSKSKGEEKISKLLIDANIRFLYNYGFPEIEKETGYKLRFDFIIFDEDNNVKRCIEYDGKQHFEGMQGGVWSHTETLEVIKKRDEAKNNYCKNKGIPLVRIPYTVLKSFTLEDLMSDKYLIN